MVFGHVGLSCTASMISGEVLSGFLQPCRAGVQSVGGRQGFSHA